MGPVNTAELIADDELVEQLRADADPAAGNEVTELLVAWRDDCQR